MTPEENLLPVFVFYSETNISVYKEEGSQIPHGTPRQGIEKLAYDVL